MCKYKEINKKYIYTQYIYRKSAEKYGKNELSYSYPMVTLWLPYGYLMVMVLLGHYSSRIIRASFMYRSCIVHD